MLLTGQPPGQSAHQRLVTGGELVKCCACKLKPRPGASDAARNGGDTVQYQGKAVIYMRAICIRFDDASTRKRGVIFVDGVDALQVWRQR